METTRVDVPCSEWFPLGGWKPLGTICLYTKLLPSHWLPMCTVITGCFQTWNCSFFVGVGFSKSGPHPCTSALPLSHGPAHCLAFLHLRRVTMDSTS